MEKTKKPKDRKIVRWLMKRALWFILLPYFITLLINIETALRLGTIPDYAPYLQAMYDPVYQTLIITLAVIGLLMRKFMKLVAQIFDRIQEQKIIAGKAEKSREEYIQEYQNYRKSLARYALGIIFLGIILAFNFSITFGGDLNTLNPNRQISAVSEFSFEYWLSNLMLSIGEWFALFIFGIWIYELIIVAVMIYRAPKFFNLNIQPAHPDKCGGFKIVGDLCLQMATIVMVPALFVSFWLVVSKHILLAPELKELLPEYMLAVGFRTPAKIALGFLVITGIAVFFWPMSTIHLIMLEERDELNYQLDGIAQRIHQLYQDVLVKSIKLSVEGQKKKLSDINSLKEMYENISKAPVWPFERRVLFKFLSSQAIPIISFLGLGGGPLETLMEIVTSLFK